MSTKELSNKENTHLPLQDRIRLKIEELKEVTAHVPAVTIVHNIQEDRVMYMCKRGLGILGINMKELTEMGPAYNHRFFNPDFVELYIPKIFGLLERSNMEEVVSYFQQVRSSPHKDWSWYLSCTKLFIHDDEGKPLLLITNAIPLDTDHFLEAAKANRMLDENKLLQKKNEAFNSLSKREMEILKMMALGESASKIAGKLFISELTVNTHRRNIKRKLGVETHYEITQLAQTFALI